jgi:hypothetical protein
MRVDLEELRLAVYRTFITTGSAPTTAALAESFSISREDTQAGLRALHERLDLVLNGDDRIVMAHPFAAVPLGFSVMGASTLWWGGCAWDSFALAHLLTDEPDLLIATRCPWCGAALAFVVGRDQPPAGEEVAHFLVPRAQMWNDVVHTCGNQRLFCDRTCVARWLRATNHEEGYVLDLDTLWRLARGWYEGRFERGYRRRSPTEASKYFRSVGLRGPFWEGGMQR